MISDVGSTVVSWNLRLRDPETVGIHGGSSITEYSLVNVTGSISVVASAVHEPNVAAP
jgi:hypothetical protein